MGAGPHPQVSQGPGETTARELPVVRALGLWRALVHSEECGLGHSRDTYQAHLASPGCPLQLAHGHAEEQSNPHDHSMESGSGCAGQTPPCWLRGRNDGHRQTSE